MIPKIIHYCWLSDDEYPQLIEKCIETWKDKLPDYEFILWDTKRFDINSTIWTKQAFEARKYAFAADYIRLQAIYIYGGIYLDTDVEILKNFDDLLNLPYFIGSQYDGLIEAAIFGAKKESDWVLNCLDYYKDRRFIKADGSFDVKALPNVMQSQIEQKRKIVQLKPDNIDKISEFLENKTSFFLFPSEYFSPKNHQTRKIFKTKNSYTVHHYNHSWFTLLNVIRLNLIKLIGLRTAEKMIKSFNLRKLLSKKES